jgi:F0F1-type ATP synthase assembly protein I
MPDSNRDQSTGAAMRLAHLAMSIGIEPAIAFGGGYLLDQKYGTAPWLMILGVLIGAYLATQGFRKLIRDLEKK